MTGTALECRDSLAEALRQGRLSGFKARSDWAACLLPLLSALGWQGGLREVVEALPHFADDLDFTNLRNTLGRLGYGSGVLRVDLTTLDPRLAPCLFAPDQGAPLVLLRHGAGGWSAFDADGRGLRTITADPGPGLAVLFRPLERTEAPGAAQAPWCTVLLRRLRPALIQALALSGAINLLTLATPVFVMLTYDRVVAASSMTTLLYLGLGVALALGAEVGFRSFRARLLAYVGARVDRLINGSAFERILSMPPSAVETAPVGDQIARLREFDGLREFFGGVLPPSMLDAPFSLLLLGVLALLAGKLAVIPIVLAVLYVLIGWLLLRVIGQHIAVLSRARAARQGLLLETVKQLRGIRCIHVEDSWLDRLRGVSADTAVAGYAVAKVGNLSQTIGHFLMMSAGLAAVTVGSLEVMADQLSVGALIAGMLLIWRILAPLQTIFLALPQLHQVIDTTGRLNRLMAMPTELARFRVRRSPDLRGRVTLAGISHRYGTASEPALVSVSCDIQPGEVVAICGPSGAGKTSLLKAIAAMYQPLAGAVLFDGIDFRQFDPHELRRSIAYVPQVCQLFRGTIAQNLRLGAPTASIDELFEAAAQAGVLDDILAMPDGFDTRIGDKELNRLPLSVQQRLALGRAYLRKAPVLVLDEPANSLDADGDQALIEQIKRLRGQTTTLLVTHRPSHIRLADRVLVLDAGRLRFSGPSTEVLAAMPKDFL